MSHRTILADARWQGHHLYYVRLLAQRSIANGRETHVVLPNRARETDEFAVHLGDLADIECHWLDSDEPRSLVREALRLAAAEDTVVFPEADFMVPHLAARRLTGRLRSRVVVLLMRTPTRGVRLRTRRRVVVAVVKAASALALAGRLHSVLQLTDTFGHAERHWLYRWIAQVRDPAPALDAVSRTEARRALGIADETFVVTTIGAQRWDKNPCLIVDAWKVSPVRTAERSAVLVVAGAQADDIRATLPERIDSDPSIIVQDRYLSHDEFATIIAASDGLVLAYSSEMPSGLLASAVRVQRPVIIAGSAWLQSIVHRFGLGIRCSLERDALAAAFAELADFSPPTTWPQAGDEDEFADALVGGDSHGQNTSVPSTSSPSGPRQVAKRILGPERTAQIGRARQRADAKHRLVTSGSIRRSNRQLTDLHDRYEGQRCVIVGNGPSLNVTPLHLLENESVVALNRGYLKLDEIGIEPTFHVCVNPHVAAQFGHEITAIDCQRFATLYCRRALGRTRRHDDTCYLQSLPDPGFAFDPRRGMWEGATVTFVAMQLMYFLGFSEVALVGVDHRFSSQGQPHQAVVSRGPDLDHFDPNYFGPGVVWQLPDLDTSEGAYRMARSAFEADGRRIIDCTVDGALTIFPRDDLAAVVSGPPSGSGRPT